MEEEGKAAALLTEAEAMPGLPRDIDDFMRVTEVRVGEGGP